MSEVQVPNGTTSVPTYVAQPAGEGPWPGVVVLHDAFGMDDDVRRQSEWLASAGFLAAAPDLFSWANTLLCIRAVFKELKARRGRVFDEVDAVRSWLAADPRCSGAVGVVGFCMTGGFALLLAKDHGFAVSSVNYGQIPGDLDRAIEGTCPIVASFGAKDMQLRGAAATLERALEAAGVPHDVKEYAGARHGFMNQHDRPVWRLMERMGAVKYAEEAADDARRRIVAFFSEHLGPRHRHPETS